VTGGTSAAPLNVPVKTSSAAPETVAGTMTSSAPAASSHRTRFIRSNLRQPSRSPDQRPANRTAERAAGLLESARHRLPLICQWRPSPIPVDADLRRLRGIHFGRKRGTPNEARNQSVRHDRRVFRLVWLASGPQNG